MNAKEDDFLDYDEDEAIRFIRNELPQEMKEKFSDDDLNYIVDLIYEFYEEKGYLNDEETEVDIDLDELTAYVIKNAKKDKVGVYTEEEIHFVVDAEITYCDSLGIFE
jgi:hypothetical protein